jgi:flagellar biosynthetic protein FliQ
MNETEVLDIGREAIWVMIKAAGPLMIVALVVGLLISIFQALTQIQEATLTFVPKMLVLFVGMLLFLPFMLATLRGFTLELFDRIVGMG